MRQGLWIPMLVALVSPAFAEKPVVDFDQMDIDVKGIVAAAKRDAKDQKAAAKDVRAAYYRAERDCVNFVFEPEGPTVSEAVWLRSTEYREECTWVGNPQHGGGQQICHEVPWYTNREKVQVSLLNRQKLFPWEREIFQACLEGRWLSVHAVEAAHKYKVSQQGGLFTLAAGQRVPISPDPNGIAADIPVVTAKGVGATFRDKWVSYYQGESVVLKLALREDVPNWFDNTLLEKELPFDAAAAYTVDFGGYASEFKASLKPGKKYYFEWQFKRVGKISKPDFVKKMETARVEYKPALQLVMR
ncbi:MAG: hypothetical protein WC728_04320 [Elusimicrobiota bacterium]